MPYGRDVVISRLWFLSVLTPCLPARSLGVGKRLTLYDERYAMRFALCSMRCVGM
jgi:hypothetical protein